MALAESNVADNVERFLLESLDADLAKVLPAFVARRYADKGIVWLRTFIDALVNVNRLEDAAAALARVSPTMQLWHLIDGYSEFVRDDYWRKLGNVYGERPEEEWQRAIDGFLSVNRLGAAMDLASRAYDKITPATALRVLEAVALAPQSEVTHLIRDGMGSYEVERVFQATDRLEGDVPTEKLMQLEVMFLSYLSDSERGAKYLFSALGKGPELFAEFVSALSGPESQPDQTIDPEAEAAKERNRRWEIAYHSLDAWNGFPGDDQEPGERHTSIITWCSEVLRLTGAAGRQEMGAREVGKVLARVPPGTDGLWPNEAAREVLKHDTTQKVAHGMYIEKVNSRGVTTRALGEGGNQERALEASFRRDADRLRLEWPESAAVLDRLANNYRHDAEFEDAEAAADRHRYQISG